MNDPNLHYKHEAYGAVGNVASAWSTLERCIDLWIWIMLGAGSRNGACLTTQLLSVRAKLMSLEALLAQKHVNEANLKSIRLFRNDTEGPAKRRNEVVHNPIIFQFDSESAIATTFRQVVSMRKTLLFEESEFNLLETYKLSQEIVLLAMRFMKIMSSIAAELFPSQKSSFLQLHASLTQSTPASAMLLAPERQHPPSGA